MLIHSDMKMADIIHLDYQLLSVLQRLNIPLGFKEMTVDEVCKLHAIDTNFFLQLANTVHDKEYFPMEEFLNFPVEWVVNYLKKTHRYHVVFKIPEIEQQIAHLENSNKSNKENIDLLLRFFKSYIREFIAHIELEEKDVFPYIIYLDKVVSNGMQLSDFEAKFSDYRIDTYISEHNNIEEKLFDLKNILIKYMPPPEDDIHFHHLLYDIFRLEADLHDHSTLEERVLIPRVRQMESVIAQKQNLNR